MGRDRFGSLSGLDGRTCRVVADMLEVEAFEGPSRGKKSPMWMTRPSVGLRVEPVPFPWLARTVQVRAFSTFPSSVMGSNHCPSGKTLSEVAAKFA